MTFQKVCHADNFRIKTKLDNFSTYLEKLEKQYL